MTLSPLDERPHAPGTDPDWSESWGFDFEGEDGTGGEARLTYMPAARLAAWWTRLDVPDEGLIVVRDDGVPMPRRVDAQAAALPTAGARSDRPRSRPMEALTLRGDGLWAELVCETAFEHWGIVLEAFGLRVDDPSDEIGERLPVGLDLEWEVSTVAPPEQHGSGYAQRGRVHGELLLASRRIPFDGTGGRDHKWGT